MGSGKDRDRERQDYVERSQGVAESDGMYFRWSNYASGELPTRHPASMRGRPGRRRSPAEFRRDLNRALVVVAVLLLLFVMVVAANVLSISPYQ